MEYENTMKYRSFLLLLLLFLKGFAYHQLSIFGTILNHYDVHQGMPSEPFVHTHGSDANEIIYAVDFFLGEGIHLTKTN